VFVSISVARSTSPCIFLLFGLNENQETDKPKKKATMPLTIALIAHRNQHSTRGLASGFTARSSGAHPSAMDESGATPPLAVRELLDMETGETMKMNYFKIILLDFKIHHPMFTP
jgi:hypothetical protein